MNRFMQAGLVAAMYFAACRLGLWINVTAGVSAVWPASGLLLGVFLLPRRPSTGIIIAGALAGGIAANLSAGFPLLISVLYVVINIGETLAGGWLLRRVSRDAVRLNHPEDVFTMVACCAGVAACAGGILAASVASLVIGAPWWTAMRVWWLADATGMMAITPLVLLVTGSRDAEPLTWTVGRLAEAAACLAALLTLCWWVFVAPHDSHRSLLAMPFPLLFPAVWAIVRFGVPGGIVVTVAADAFVVWSVVGGTGPFGAEAMAVRLIAAQLFVAVVSVVFPSVAVAFELSRRSSQASRRLALRVELAAEDERGRLSRELHDDLGQRLVALKLQLQVAQISTGARSDTSFTGCLSTVDGLIDDVRQLSRSLRPAPFEAGYLISALTALARAEARRGSFCVLVDAPSDDDVVLAREAELGCYRVVGEALANVVQHARAKNVAVSVVCDARTVELRVIDDGQGFDAGPAVRRAALSGRLGLLGMKERIEQLNGSLAIRSRRGGGTIVTCRVPAPDINTAVEEDAA